MEGDGMNPLGELVQVATLGLLVACLIYWYIQWIVNSDGRQHNDVRCRREWVPTALLSLDGLRISCHARGPSEEKRKRVATAYGGGHDAFKKW
jgi:hypothetical protein